MKHHRWTILPLLTALLFPANLPVKADVLEKTKNIGGTIVHYKVVLPKDYDASKAYPGVLAFGGGPQTMNVVDGVIARNFREEAEKRGYIVVVPAAPDGQLFFEGGERIFPEFLKQILADYKIQDNKFHIAGPSNGGISAFHVASLNPEYFLSITAFPGYLWEETPAHIQAISKMCINMFVGELDPMGWQDMMQRQASEFRAKGMTAQYTVEKGQPHRLETLAGPGAARLFDLFEKAKHGCGK
jgi:poly(3-hydroxybutyrate) depolymerase